MAPIAKFCHRIMKMLTNGFGNFSVPKNHPRKFSDSSLSLVLQAVLMLKNDVGEKCMLRKPSQTRSSWSGVMLVSQNLKKTKICNILLWNPSKRSISHSPRPLSAGPIRYDESMECLLTIAFHLKPSIDHGPLFDEKSSFVVIFINFHNWKFDTTNPGFIKVFAYSVNQ